MNNSTVLGSGPNEWFSRLSGFKKLMISTSMKVASSDKDVQDFYLEEFIHTI